MNGAGTGMEIFRLLLELLVRRRAINVFSGVALGVPFAAAARLLGVVAKNNRKSAASTVASAWFATPTSVG